MVKWELHFCSVIQDSIADDTGLRPIVHIPL